jgi:Flp pilus assembly protein TadG
MLWSAPSSTDTSNEMRRADDPANNRRRRFRARVSAVHRDQRGLMTSFVVRTVIIFALLVVGIEETGQVVLAQVRASGAAGTAAQAGADEFHASRSQHRAEAAAIAAMLAKDPQARMVSFSVATDGAVTVTASEESSTLFVQHLPYVKSFWVQRATQTEIHSIA